MSSIDEYRSFLMADFKDSEFVETNQEKGFAEPLTEKAYDENAKIIDLVFPDLLSCGEKNLLTLINERKTRRVYSPQSLSLEELSYLLWCVQGIKKKSENGFGTLRTVSSAGGRHPFETYLVVLNVNNLKRGIYRYLPLEHKLLFVSVVEDLEEKLSEACSNQKFVSKSAVTFIWTTIPYRMEWRYGVKSYKVIAIEAGHVCQNLYLAAESIGSGICAISGYDQKKMDALLSIDVNEEFTVYLASVGKQLVQ